MTPQYRATNETTGDVIDFNRFEEFSRRKLPIQSKYDIECFTETKRHFFDRLKINQDNLYHWFQTLIHLTNDELIISCYLIEKHDHTITDIEQVDMELYKVYDREEMQDFARTLEMDHDEELDIDDHELLAMYNIEVYDCGTIMPPYFYIEKR